MIENSYMYQSPLRQLNDRFRQFFRADLSILIVLCLIAQHSFLIKVAGLGLLLLLNTDLFRRVRVRNLPAFYWFLPALEVLKFLILDRDFSSGHIAAFSVGMSYWIASLLVCMVLYDKVSHDPADITERSLGFFTVTNFLFSLGQFARICFIEHTINPYNTGHDHPYGISSGDLIHGLLQGVHLTNAFVSLFLVLYYSSRNKYKLTFLALIPLLLTGSNYTTMLLLLCLGLYWLLSPERKSRTRLLLLIGGFSALFYILVTPLNAKYLAEKLSLITFSKPVAGEQYQQRQDALLHDYLRNPEAHDEAYRELQALERQINYYVNPAFRFGDAVVPKGEELIRYDFGKSAGKTTAYRQTWQYLKSSPQHFLLGAGLGGFSSKLAFNFSGIMPQSSINKYLPAYETPVFRKNHKSIYAYLRTQHVIMHSESNRPFSTYNQLLGEYGVLGLLAFLLLYVWWFFRRIDKRSYALPLMIAMLFMLNLDYLIESLSILFFFEFLMFLNIKQRNAPAAA